MQLQLLEHYSRGQVKPNGLFCGDGGSVVLGGTYGRMCSLGGGGWDGVGGGFEWGVRVNV